MSELILLVSVQNIKQVTQVHGTVDEKLIQPEIDNVQKIYLEPLIGKALYNRLLDGVKENNLTPDESQLIDLYILKVIAYYVLSELPEGLSYQFYTTGLVGMETQNASRVSWTELTSIAKTYKAKAEVHASRLINYLEDKASPSLFPQYLIKDNYHAPGDKVFTCPFFLD